MVTLVPRIVVAGTASGVGKTTVATGLMAALERRGLDVAGFKVGPDFIDPGYHAAATGRPARNLDAFLSGPELIAPLFAHGSAGADLAVVEGVMGLFDGVVTPPAPPAPPAGDGDADPAARGGGGAAAELASTAQVAKLLDAPVVLVVDARGLGRSIAAMVGGYAAFDPAVRLAGVIANRVGSARHVELLAAALAPLGLPLLGAIPRDDKLATPSRHLGLVPFAERPAQARRTVAELAGRLAASVDLDALLATARSAPRRPAAPWSAAAAGHGAAGGHGVRIAVAGGPAFTFMYSENLELLAAAGATLAPFDPTVDERLPERTAALYLGGGFPEVHGPALAANERLRAEVAAFAGSGRPVLAECGGLLYLCRTLDGQPMCAVLDAEAALGRRLTLGYRQARAAAGSAVWPAGARTRGHEFHHSTVTPPSGGGATTGGGRAAAWRLGPDGVLEGFVSGGVHASFLHTHWAATPEAAGRLVAAAVAGDRGD
jgi:cobyrinic acid a,c-diamide synthase